MEHRPYPRIHTAMPDRAPAASWVATEKIHGANLVVAADGNTVRIGKRKAWLADDEPFFGWQLLRASLCEGAHALWRALGGDRPVRLHGELYGGAYPHPAVPAIDGNSAVQTGVWYAPDVRFSLFDVQVERDDGPVFLAHRALEALAREHRIESVPVLGRGTRGELHAMEPRFTTRVPTSLGLPTIAGNVAEGLVLKPDVAMAVSERPAVKRKIAEFDEGRFDDGAAWDPNVALPVDALLARADALMNPARLASARSKVGVANESALRDEAVLDAMVDLEAAFPRAVGALRDAALDRLREALHARAEALSRRAQSETRGQK